MSRPLHRPIPTLAPLDLDFPTWLTSNSACATRRHHLVNVLLPRQRCVVVSPAVRMTGALRSAFGAALFALHPLHVESVAWAAERKDVLQRLFSGF